jgi:hypothetical protein
MIFLYIETEPGTLREIEVLDVSPETPRDEVMEAIADELRGEPLCGIGLCGKASVAAFGWLVDAFDAEMEMIGPSMRLTGLHTPAMRLN